MLLCLINPLCLLDEELWNGPGEALEVGGWQQALDWYIVLRLHLRMKELDGDDSAKESTKETKRLYVHITSSARG